MPGQPVFRPTPQPIRRQCRQAPTAPTRSSRTDSAPQEQQKDHRQALICAACAAQITSLDQGVSINNSHCHTFPNPLGQVFTIRCFAAAPGCIPHGEATPEFSWFAGYRWRLALCGNCLEHLGWQYLGDNVFFGLIAANLIEPHT